MEAEGVDLVALLEGGPVPQISDDLDDFFTDDILEFLSSEGPQPVDHVLQQQPIAPTTSAVSVTLPAAMTPSSSCSSRSEESASPSTSVPPVAPETSPAFAALHLQSAAAIPRLVTTAAAQQMWTAMLQAACRVQPAATCNDEAKIRSGQPVGTSRQCSRDSSGDSSDTDQDDADMVDSKSKASAGNKRKAPEVDWRQIEDPAERRRQRRLAKNRVTAARSRERKKAMWSELEVKLKNMENENLQLRAMLEQFARENATLKSQLLNITRAGVAAGGATGMSQARAGKTMDPAVILPVFIVTLLVVCSLLPCDKACALLGSVLPLTIMASMLGSVDGASGSSVLNLLFPLLHMLGTLVSRSSRSLQRSFKRLFFERHRYLGRKDMQKLADVQLNLLQRQDEQCGILPASDDGNNSEDPRMEGFVSATSLLTEHVLPGKSGVVLGSQVTVKIEPVH